MSRITERELRAAVRLRAAGRPAPGLRQRIREATRPTHGPRSIRLFGDLAHRRPILARLTAVAAVAAVVVLAPVVFGGLEAQRLELIPDNRRPDQIAPAPAFTAGESERDDDDVGDDEDGLDEADDADDDDVGDDEDGLDEADDADDAELDDDD